MINLIRIKKICIIFVLNIYLMWWLSIGVRMCILINKIDCLEK